MRFESPSSFFYLLCCEDTGDYLCVDAAADAATGALALRLDGRAVDGAMWAREELEGGSLRLTAATVACTLLLSPAPDATPAGGGERGFRCTAKIEHADGSPVAVGDGSTEFRLMRGPSALPSESLRHLREEGWVVLPELLHPDTTADIRRHCEPMLDEALAGKERRGKRVSLGDVVNATPSVVKAATHPLALYLLEEYIKSPIHLGHPPATAIVTPQDESYEHFGKNTEFQSTADKGGWHSDYPFSSQQGVNLEDFPPEVCFGCEYLTMIDGFTELNGVSSLSLSLSLLQSLSVSPSLSSGAKGNQVLCCLRRPR